MRTLADIIVLAFNITNDYDLFSRLITEVELDTTHDWVAGTTVYTLVDCSKIICQVKNGEVRTNF